MKSAKTVDSTSMVPFSGRTLLRFNCPIKTLLDVTVEALLSLFNF